MRILLILLMLACGVRAAYKDTVRAIQPTHLKQYLKLRETSGTTAYDSSGNGYNGTYVRCMLSQRGFTSQDTSVRLRPSDSSYINGLASGMEDKFKRQGTVSFLYKNISWTDSVRQLFYMYFTEGRYISIAQYTGPDRIMFRFTDDIYYVYQNNLAIEMFKNGQWMNFTISWQTQSNYKFLTFYVNGVPITKTALDTSWLSTNITNITYGKAGSLYYSNGYISHIAMWDTCLSTANIQRLADPFRDDSLKTLVTFGDSWTEGYYASVDSLQYGEKLARKLGCMHINSGVGHSQLQYNSADPVYASGFGRYKNGLIDYKPSYVAILYGLNDIFGYTTSVDTFYTHLRTIVDSVKKYVPSNRIVLGGQYAIKNVYNYTEARRAAYTNKIIQVSNETGVKYADVFSAFIAADTTQMMYGDSIHPYDSGMAVITNTFYNQFKTSVPTVKAWPVGTQYTMKIVVNSSRVTESDTAFTHQINLTDSITKIDPFIDSSQNIAVCTPDSTVLKYKDAVYVKGKKLILNLLGSKTTSKNDTFIICFGKALNVKDYTYTYSNSGYTNRWSFDKYSGQFFDDLDKNNGTLSSVDTSAGKICTGSLFNAADDNVNCGPVIALNNRTNVTIESNMYFDNFTTTRIPFVAYINSSWRLYPITSATTFTTQIGGFNGAFNLSGNMSPTNWYHVVLRFDLSASVDSNRLQVYVNGAKKTLTYAGTAPANTGSLVTTNFLIGNTTTSMIGKEDEIGILSKSVSAGWILDRYRSIYEPSTFYSIGAIEKVPVATKNKQSKLNIGLGIGL